MLNAYTYRSYGFSRIFRTVLLELLLAFLLSQMEYKGTAKGATMQFTTLHYNKVKLTWNSAYQTCRVYGQLVNIYNDAIHHAVEKSVESAGNDVFIGLHNQGGPNEDDWRWSDCRPLQTEWHKWKETDSDEMFCSYFDSYNRDWRAMNCGSDKAYSVCAETQGECYYDNHIDSECDMDADKKEEVKAENISHCQTLCDESTQNLDLCWAYEYKDDKTCQLIINHIPFVCDSIITNARGIFLGIRKCFAFENIKDKILHPDEKNNNPVVNCDLQTTEGYTASTEQSAPPTTLGTTTTAHPTTTTPPITLGTTTTAHPTTTKPPTTSDITTMTSASIAETTASFTSYDLTTDLDLGFRSTPFIEVSSEGHLSQGSDGFVRALSTDLSDVSSSLVDPTGMAPLEESSHSNYMYVTSTNSFSASQLSSQGVSNKLCTCRCPHDQSDLINRLQDLLLDKRNLSSYRRKMVSISDDRPSAKSMGVSGVLLIVFSTLFVVLLDVNKLSGFKFRTRFRRRT